MTSMLCFQEAANREGYKICQTKYIEGGFHHFDSCSVFSFFPEKRSLLDPFDNAQFFSETIATVPDNNSLTIMP